MTLILWAVIGYLLGSVPFGIVITRALGLGDLRQIGSGNIGATNVLRTGRKGLAAATLLLDGLKATAAVLVAGRWGYELGLIAGAGAFLGHLFPVWLGFKGGKGVATYIGILLGAFPPAFGIFAMIWIGVAIATRYSSAAALAASAVTPLLTLALGGGVRLAALLAALAVLLWWKHSENIARLRAGTEGKIGKKG